MKKYLLIAVVALFGIYMSGCGKKQEAMEQMPEPMSMDQLGTMNTASQASPEAKATENNSASTVKTSETKASVEVNAGNTETAPAVQSANTEVTPKSASLKPTSRDIQAALKNAGFYNGAVDGKIGPMTKKAVAAFQKSNGLKADGKVGSKTWEALSRHLSSEPGQAAPANTR